MTTRPLPLTLAVVEGRAQPAELVGDDRVRLAGSAQARPAADVDAVLRVSFSARWRGHGVHLVGTGPGGTGFVTSAATLGRGLGLAGDQHSGWTGTAPVHELTRLRQRVRVLHRGATPPGAGTRAVLEGDDDHAPPELAPIRAWERATDRLAAELEAAGAVEEVDHLLVGRPRRWLTSREVAAMDRTADGFVVFRLADGVTDAQRFHADLQAAAADLTARALALRAARTVPAGRRTWTRPATPEEDPHRHAWQGPHRWPARGGLGTVGLDDAAGPRPARVLQDAPHQGTATAWVAQAHVDRDEEVAVTGRWRGLDVAVFRGGEGRVNLSPLGDPAAAVAAGMTGDQHEGWHASADSAEVERTTATVTDRLAGPYRWIAPHDGPRDGPDAVSRASAAMADGLLGREPVAGFVYRGARANDPLLRPGHTWLAHRATLATSVPAHALGAAGADTLVAVLTHGARPVGPPMRSQTLALGPHAWFRTVRHVRSGATRVVLVEHIDPFRPARDVVEPLEDVLRRLAAALRHQGDLPGADAARGPSPAPGGETVAELLAGAWGTV